MPIEVDETAILWIALSRVELLKSNSGYLNPISCTIPEILEAASTVALGWVGNVGGTAFNCDAIDRTLNALVVDGRFEARWALVYFCQRVINLYRGLVAYFRLA